MIHLQGKFQSFKDKEMIFKIIKSQPKKALNKKKELTYESKYNKYTKRLEEWKKKRKNKLSQNTSEQTKKRKVTARKMERNSK